jgi:hypothetical protein
MRVIINIISLLRRNKMGIWNGYAHCSWCGKAWNHGKYATVIFGLIILAWDCLTLFSFWWRPHFCSRVCKLNYKQSKGQ